MTDIEERIDLIDNQMTEINNRVLNEKQIIDQEAINGLWAELSQQLRVLEGLKGEAETSNDIFISRLVSGEIEVPEGNLAFIFGAGFLFISYIVGRISMELRADILISGKRKAMVRRVSRVAQIQNPIITVEFERFTEWTRLLHGFESFLTINILILTVFLTVTESGLFIFLALLPFGLSLLFSIPADKQAELIDDVLATFPQNDPTSF